MSRKKFTTTIQEDTLKEIKKLAIDLDCSANDLIEEGINYILKKNTGHAVRENVEEYQGSKKLEKRTRRPKNNP